ncbi:MAG TPA: hypothetical protein VJV03_00425, partial [Pyrinomonadaceae bacterium]|nr:hypothetical protein [Pyrinomonadaceae bacterium]
MTRKSQVLLALTCAVLFSSCSKTAESPANVASTPTPEAKMEGQSANWKLTVVSVDHVPQQDSFMPGSPEGPENRYDTLQLTVEATYTGS